MGDFRSFLEEERGQGTISAYSQDLRHFMTWFEQANGVAFSPIQMNSHDCRDYRAFCLEVERCAPATWNRRRSTLKLLHGWIMTALRIELFPFEKQLKRAEEEEQAPRWLSQIEERQVMRQVELNIVAANTAARKARAIRDAALVAMMRYAGLRVEEVANLETGDVQIGERKGAVTVRLGKREKKRVVPLSASARDAIGSWLANRPGGTVFLFVDEQGQGMSTRAIQKRIEALGAQTHIEGLTCHALRHTCAKSMLDAGRPITEVQRILGHEKLETTARYVQPGKEDLEQAVEAGELGRMVKQFSVR
jgi:site-specific recombinase XerD